MTKDKPKRIPRKKKKAMKQFDKLWNESFAGHFDEPLTKLIKL